MSVRIRPLLEGEIDAAEAIFRVAFGTHFSLPDPARFSIDRSYVRSRWVADPSRAFGARLDGQLVGSCFVSRWGSVGVLGPVTVHPDYWDQGVASALVVRGTELLDQWQVSHSGLYTFADSPKHVGLCEKVGFRARFLTRITSREVEAPVRRASFLRMSDVPDHERGQQIGACKRLAASVYEGLDLTIELVSIHAQDLGDTILLEDAEGLAGFAACHSGEGTEAGTDACYIKFAAVRGGEGAADRLAELLVICEAYAAEQELTKLVTGVNLGCENAARVLTSLGFRAVAQGVAMHRPNTSGYHHPEAFVLGDWR